MLFVTDRQGLKTETNDKKTQLESLGSVVVSGCPPLASRICRRVSLNSRPGTEDVTVAGPAEGAEVPAVLVGGATPSRNAFSCATFCARSRLSASICNLTAARAFFSSSFSKKTTSFQLAIQNEGVTNRGVSPRDPSESACSLDLL